MIINEDGEGGEGGVSTSVADIANHAKLLDLRPMIQRAVLFNDILKVNKKKFKKIKEAQDEDEIYEELSEISGEEIIFPIIVECEQEYLLIEEE